jgi:hypothetical protein
LRLDCEHEYKGYVAVGISDCGIYPQLLVEGWISPPPRAGGFSPGVLVIPETNVAFLGLGENVIVYALAPLNKLAHDQTEVGFWYWARHGDYVLMSGELEFAVWTIQGEKLWSAWVEPPWCFDMEGMTVILDVMGNVERRDLKSGEVLE